MKNKKRWTVECDYDVLTDVMLGSPENYYWLPTSSVAEYNIKKGASFDLGQACQQHESLCRIFEKAGVVVHMVPPKKELPDIPFTRDTTTMTPWGMLGLNMHVADRQPEVNYVLDYVKGLGIEVLGQIHEGTVEGGDICIARRDLLILGCSGGRTSHKGAAELSEIFRKNDYDVYIHEFERFFLHLDTFFSLISDTQALVCVDIVEDDFIQYIEKIGLSIIPVTYKEMRQLGANILALGDSRVLSAAHNTRVNQAMKDAGIAVFEADITQFTLGGGGIHCLTMPLARTPA